MAGKGGYQRPGKPAATSGPGKFSRRTDGGPSEDSVKQAARYVSGGDYGDGQEMMAIQQGAPMAAAPETPRPSAIPLSAPSERPDEPVTAGAPVGPGPGPEALGLQPETDEAARIIRALYVAAPSPGLRRLVEQLIAEGR